jgi:hypothetical protein
MERGVGTSHIDAETWVIFLILPRSMANLEYLGKNGCIPDF